eukprot:c9955_g1_i3.p1 GENE.c9955_g1_i3~~c9955_g1_i3.p1  ORF type:complete len:168 (-),score=53.96 c9955_g1_i3:20-523(-)
MDMVDGSGWMLVGNLAPNSRYLPDSIGIGRNAFAENGSYVPENYDSMRWNSSRSYWIRHVGMEVKHRIAFVTGDRQMWCALNLTMIRQYSRIGDPPNVTILKSYNTLLKGGDKTAVTNELPEYGSRILIGCHGDFMENKQHALWVQNGSPEWGCFINAHGGVGVFVQ